MNRVELALVRATALVPEHWRVSFQFRQGAATKVSVDKFDSYGAALEAARAIATIRKVPLALVQARDSQPPKP